jgi:hypothetical protein
MRILIFVIAILGVPLIGIFFFRLKGYFNHFVDSLTRTEEGHLDPGKMIGMPRYKAKQYFILYTITIIVVALCLYEIAHKYINF